MAQLWQSFKLSKTELRLFLWVVGEYFVVGHESVQALKDLKRSRARCHSDPAGAGEDL
jgi:hypothetical protein